MLSCSYAKAAAAERPLPKLLETCLWAGLHGKLDRTPVKPPLWPIFGSSRWAPLPEGMPGFKGAPLQREGPCWKASMRCLLPPGVACPEESKGDEQYIRGATEELSRVVGHAHHVWRQRSLLHQLQEVGPVLLARRLRSNRAASWTHLGGLSAPGQQWCIPAERQTGESCVCANHILQQPSYWRLHMTRDLLRSQWTF